MGDDQLWEMTSCGRWPVVGGDQLWEVTSCGR